MHNQLTTRLARGEENVKSYENPEWQANVFAAELLAPSDSLSGMSVDEISETYGCSLQVANIQLSQNNKTEGEI